MASILRFSVSLTGSESNTMIIFSPPSDELLTADTGTGESAPCDSTGVSSQTNGAG